MGDQPRWPRGTPGGGHVPGPGPGRWRPERRGNRGRHGGTPGTPDWADRVSGRIRGHGSGGPDDTSHLSERDFRDVVPSSDPGSDDEVMWKGAVQERLRSLGYNPDEVEADLDEEGFLGAYRAERASGQPDLNVNEYVDGLIGDETGNIDSGRGGGQNEFGAKPVGFQEWMVRDTVKRRVPDLTDAQIDDAIAQARVEWAGTNRPRTGSFVDFVAAVARRQG